MHVAGYSNSICPLDTCTYTFSSAVLADIGLPSINLFLNFDTLFSNNVFFCNSENPLCEDVGCGKWENPTIPNPDYKGKWKAPLIDNPAYKGEWKPKRISNPDYFEDMEPFRMTPIVSKVIKPRW